MKKIKQKTKSVWNTIKDEVKGTYENIKHIPISKKIGTAITTLGIAGMLNASSIGNHQAVRTQDGKIKITVDKVVSDENFYVLDTHDNSSDNRILNGPLDGPVTMTVDNPQNAYILIAKDGSNPNKGVTRVPLGAVQPYVAPSVTTTAPVTTASPITNQINSWQDYIDNLSPEKSGDLKIRKYSLKVGDYDNSGAINVTAWEALAQIYSFRETPEKWNFLIEKSAVNTRQKTDLECAVKEGKVWVKNNKGKLTDQEFEFETGFTYKIQADTGLNVVVHPDGHVEIPLSMKCVKESGLENMLLTPQHYMDQTQTAPDYTDKNLYVVVNEGVFPGGKRYLLAQVKPFVWAGSEEVTLGDKKEFEIKGATVIKEDIRKLDIPQEEVSVLKQKVLDWYNSRGARFQGELDVSGAIWGSSSEQETPSYNIKKNKDVKETEAKLKVAQGKLNAHIDATLVDKIVSDYTFDSNGKETLHQTTYDILVDVFGKVGIPGKYGIPKGLSVGAGASAGLIEDHITEMSVKDGIEDQEMKARAITGGLVATAGWDGSEYKIPLQLDVKGRWHPIGNRGNVDLTDKSDYTRTDLELQIKTNDFLKNFIKADKGWKTQLKNLDAYVRLNYGQNKQNGTVVTDINRVEAGLSYSPLDWLSVRGTIVKGNHPEKYTTGGLGIQLNYK